MSLYADEAEACTATHDLLSEVRAIPEAKSAVVGKVFGNVAATYNRSSS